MSENRLFVADKPVGISCAKFLSQLKKKYGVKKGGFSGTLDVFATGALIVAFGQYPRLFRFLKKSPKRYEALLYLGAISDTLDVEGIKEVRQTRRFSIEEIEEAIAKFRGTITYQPPKFSAKKVDGKRSYTLARAGKDVELKEITTEVYDLVLKSYAHPFVRFEAEVSEGGYIRSLGSMIAESLGVEGCLKELRRLREGAFVYENENALKVSDFLDLKQNVYRGDTADILLGRVLKIEDFECTQEGRYFVVTDNFLSVIEIKAEVKYMLNRIEL